MSAAPSNFVEPSGTSGGIGENASAQQSSVNADHQTGAQSDSDDSQTDIDSNDSDDIDSEEEKPDDANREPLVDPASLESETYESCKPDEIERVWKDYVTENEGDRLVKEQLKFVVSDKKADSDPEARGIQSLYNSSASDCALYAMFALNDTFDYLFRDAKARYKDPVSVVRILKDYVVTPLRKIGFVGAKRTIALKLAMQRAGDLDMLSVIGEQNVLQFIDNFMKSIGVDPLVNEIFAGPAMERVMKKTKNVLEVDVKPLPDDPSRSFTSQQLLEQYTLTKEGVRKLTNPRNLVIQLNRKGDSSGSFGSVRVFPLQEIELVDCMFGVSRKCAICEMNSKVEPAVWECKSCFMSDFRHMKLKYCTYCAKCFEEAHALSSPDSPFRDHVANQIYGPEFLSKEDVKLADKWTLSKARKVNRNGTEELAESVVAEQVLLSEQDSPEFPSYPFELYAIICQNLSNEGYVAFVRSDVELESEEIAKYTKTSEQASNGLNVSNSAATTTGNKPDNADTKPKNPVPVEATNASSLTTTTDTTGTSATTLPLESPITQTDKEMTAKVWVYFDPQEISRTDPRGGYCIPQVHILEDFQKLIESRKEEEIVDQYSRNINEKRRYQILYGSVALFYRPMMRSIEPAQ